MNTLIRLLTCAFFIFVTTSCGLHERRSEYIIAAPYRSVESKLENYYAAQEKPFTLFQDKVIVVKNKEKQDQMHFSLFKWAPDIGIQKLHETRLSKLSADQSRLELVTPPIHRWGTSHEARSKDIDRWLSANFNIRSKTTTEFIPETGVKGDLWYRTNRILD